MLLKSLVVGYTYSAIIHACETNSFLIVNNDRHPFFFEEHNQDWFKKLFELSIAGKVLFGSSVKSLRFENNSVIVVHSNNKTKITFDKCTVFNDDTSIFENELLNSTQLKSTVLDWVNIRSCGVHSFKELSTNSNFVNKIYFYKSDRISGNHNKKDAVCLSYLDQSQLANFDYSDTMARFKMEQVMLDNGIKGSSRGVDKKTKKQSLRKIKLEVSKREVYHNTYNHYRDSEYIVFKNYEARKE